MTTWFISDTHFGEQPVRRQKLSGMCASELDALIEHNWRERVGPADTVWHLGDIGTNWPLIGGLPGSKRLILAHDPDRKADIRNSGIFASIHETFILRDNNAEFVLIHNPDGIAAAPGQIVIRGHHHYRPPAQGHRSACVDHNDWGPVRLEGLLQG